MFKFKDKRLQPVKFYKYSPFVLVKSAEEYNVKPGERVWVNTGLTIDKESELYTHFKEDSFLMLNLYDYYGLLGLYQPSLNIYSLNYNKELKILVGNLTDRDIFIKKYDVIAQAIVLPHLSDKITNVKNKFKELRNENYSRKNIR